MNIEIHDPKTWPEWLKEATNNDTTVHAVYQFSRREGLTDEKWLALLAETLLSDKRTLADRLVELHRDGRVSPEPMALPDGRMLNWRHQGVVTAPAL